MTGQPLTEDSLRKALQELHDIGSVPERAPRKPIPRARYEERLRHFEETGDDTRLEILKLCYEPSDAWTEEKP